MVKKNGRSRKGRVQQFEKNGVQNKGRSTVKHNGRKSEGRQIAPTSIKKKSDKARGVQQLKKKTANKARDANQ